MGAYRVGVVARLGARGEGRQAVGEFGRFLDAKPRLARSASLLEDAWDWVGGGVLGGIPWPLLLVGSIWGLCAIAITIGAVREIVSDMTLWPFALAKVFIGCVVAPPLLFIAFLGSLALALLVLLFLGHFAVLVMPPGVLQLVAILFAGCLASASTALVILPCVLLGRFFRRLTDWSFRWVLRARGTDARGVEGRPFVLFLRPWESDICVRYVADNEVDVGTSSRIAKAMVGPDVFSLNELVYRSCRKAGLAFSSIGGIWSSVSGPHERASHNGWKVRVAKLMSDAWAIVLLPTASAGTQWEVDQIVERRLEHKTLILNPPDEYLFPFDLIRRSDKISAYRSSVRASLERHEIELGRFHAGIYKLELGESRRALRLAGISVSEAGGWSAYTLSDFDLINTPAASV